MYDNEECKYFYQHYGYNKKKKRLHRVACGHCLNKKKNCKGCTAFEPRKDEASDLIMDIFASILTSQRNLEFIKEKIEKLNL